MERHLKILEHALSSLRRRTGKSLAIIVVYAFTIAVLASVLFLTHALRTEANLLLTAAPDLIVQRQIAGRHELVPYQYAETIRQLPGVANVQPRLWGYYYDALTKANYTLMVAPEREVPGIMASACANPTFRASATDMSSTVSTRAVRPPSRSRAP